MHDSKGALMEPVDTPLPYDRFLGRIRGTDAGPTLICVGGIHGNEPAGVLALERVLETLQGRAGRVDGEFVALAGNRSALAEKKRFLDRDLNRAWTDERLERLRGDDGLNGDTEDREQVELLQALDDAVTDSRGPVYLLDLHTTSGTRGMFSTFGDSLPNRDFAEHIPVPMVLGLEELVEGTLLGFLGEHGLVAIAVESGQHDEPLAIDRAEAAIWIAIRTAGLLAEADVPEARQGQEMLRRESRGLPRAVEMRYKYDVSPELEFSMEPGYENFQSVSQGETIAHDREGDVVLSENGILLMPLYQEQGEDGFFLVREFSPFWLRVSYALRSAHAGRIARGLPGVAQDSKDPDVLRVNRRIARLFALQFFHLLGFRSVKDEGDTLVVRRRRFDEARFIARGPTPEHLR
ncbi:MAG: aspartoacylase [Gemmatimonadales bacterium]|nr:aspartoacylase [Gemmatimonadales bacterium]